MSYKFTDKNKLIKLFLAILQVWKETKTGYHAVHGRRFERNPGPGGYGAILKCGSLEKELSGGFALTTNNRMELLAVIAGLEAIKWERAR